MARAVLRSERMSASQLIHLPAGLHRPSEPVAREFKVGGTVYHWVGGLGTLFESRERGVQPMQMRRIAGRLFYALAVRHRWFARPCVAWGLAAEFASPEAVRSVRHDVFCVSDSAA